MSSLQAAAGIASMIFTRGNFEERIAMAEKATGFTCTYKEPKHSYSEWQCDEGKDVFFIDGAFWLVEYEDNNSDGSLDAGFKLGPGKLFFATCYYDYDGGTTVADSIYHILKQADERAKTSDFVVIPKVRYKKFIESEERLDALESAGVDNWQGYDYAMQLLREWKDETE